MTAHLGELDRRLEATGKLRRRLVQLVGAMGTEAGPVTDDLLDLVEEMTMLDTTVQRRISILVYAELESAYDH